MDNISNRTLAILLVTAIVVSLGATVTTLNRLSSGPTGKANYDMGEVQLEVSDTVSIILLNDTIDFGSGYVNDSCGGGGATYAVLNAGATYNDTDGDDCWTASETPTSIHIENDGNLNVTLKVYGPTNLSFFTTGGAPYGESNPYGIEFRARDYEAGSCDTSTGGTFQQTWLNFGGQNQTICDDFQHSSTDELAIDVRVVIPSDLGSGVYQNNTIEFTARSN